MEKLKIFIIAALCWMLAMGLAAAAQGRNDASGDPLAGKKVCVFGDSYAKNHRRPFEEAWHFRAAQRHGMAYQNCGRNGSAVAFDRTREGFGPAMVDRCGELDADADLVLVIAGHNDADKIGSSADSLRLFEEAAQVLIDRIRLRCPHARVAWVTPWRVPREGFKPVVRAIRKVCRKKGVPVLNNYRKKCPVRVGDADFRKRYFQGPNDTAHLNAQGHELFLPEGDRFLQQIMK